VVQPAVAPSLPLPGDVLAGKYQITRLIGEGGMGAVFEASNVRLRRRVAIKVLLPHMLAEPELVARFLQEARAAATIQSPFVARVFDVDAAASHAPSGPPGLPYMVMEYLEGRDLETELEERRQLPVSEAVDIVMQAARGMAEAHQRGIIHRDLKPSNLFLIKDELGRRSVKVLDFGISKVLGPTNRNLTATTATIGTPLYMSPEQIRSSKNVDVRTDVWSLGVILYEALCGRQPFMGSGPTIAAAVATDEPPPPTQFRDDLPKELLAILSQTLRKYPQERFADAATLAAALATVPHVAETRAHVTIKLPAAAKASDSFANAETIAGDTLPATAVFGAGPRRQTRPRRAAMALALFFLVALVGLGGYVLMRTLRHTDSGAHPQLNPKTWF
jgi:serine/threonine-protein kinase